MLSDLISESVKFPGGMPPDPPRFGMLCLGLHDHVFYYLKILAPHL